MLFRRLSVFVGGFTLEAAKAIDSIKPAPESVTAHSTSSRSPSTLDSIAALVDHSLLRHEPGPAGAPRYLMLETIREFGLELLEDSGEAAALRDTHAAYFASLDGQLEPNRLNPGERFDDRLLRIGADHPNYREALSHLVANGDAPGVLRLAGALAPFWNQGHLREGRQWLEWALERTPDDDSLQRGIALAGLSLVLWSQSEIARASPAADHARAIGDACGDAELLALAVHMQGMVEVTRGNWEQAEHLMGEALAIQRAIGIAGYGAWALAALGTIALRRGDEAACAQQAGEALAMFRAIGHASGAAVALSTLAELAAQAGDERAAFANYREALGLWADASDRLTSAWAFGGLAVAAAAWDQPELAATLIGAIDARLDETGADLWQGDRRLYERATAAARAALGEQRFAGYVAAGRELPFSAAVAAASSVAVPTPLDDPSARVRIVSTVNPTPPTRASRSAC